jgi:GH35 family endo-1,4-beta-xylanase
MNRRDFLKTVGLGAATAAVRNGSLYSQEDRTSAGQGALAVLDQVDFRIEKFRKGDVILNLTEPGGKAVPAGAKVQVNQTRHEFLFGCNIFKLNRCRTEQDNEAYQHEFAALLNYATLPFYWWMYTRQRGQPEDARTDQIVRWCKAHNVTTKGHPLAWNWGEPPWLPDDPDAAMKEQFDRIERCVGKFKGDIDIWDVVNEATHYDRDQAWKDAPRLTKAIQKMGVGQYVRSAFSIARKANPQATLVINDYRTDEAFAEKVLAELVDKDGKPMYDVIGIQSHMHGGYWGAQRTWDVCERFAKFGKPLHYTEATLLSGEQGYELRQKRREAGFQWVTTPEGEAKQAEQVVEFYRVLFSHPAVQAITWWDFTDQNAWQGAPAGFVRADMSPKPAYERLMKLIKDQWWTRQQATVAEGGKLRLRGFFGHYEVEAQADGRKLNGVFHLSRGVDEVEVRLS